jgi:uncharacterized damage-inducible protein DinB
MKAADKNMLIESWYRSTEALLDQAIGCYQNLNEETLNFSLDGKSWSIAQCLSHLNSYGKYYIPQIEQALLNANQSSKVTYISGWLGAYFVRIMNSTKKFKAAKKHLPNVKNAHDEVAEFISQQEQFLSILQSAETIDLDQSKISISVNKLIKLKMGDILAFMVAHNERHASQIKQIINKLNNH